MNLMLWISELKRVNCRFSGCIEDELLHPKEFIEKLERIFETSNVPEFSKLSLMRRCFEGPALLWARWEITNKSKYEEIKTRLYEKYNVQFEMEYGRAIFSSRRYVRNHFGISMVQYFENLCSKAKYLMVGLSDESLALALIEHFSIDVENRLTPYAQSTANVLRNLKLMESTEKLEVMREKLSTVEDDVNVNIVIDTESFEMIINDVKCVAEVVVHRDKEFENYAISSQVAVLNDSVIVNLESISFKHDEFEEVVTEVKDAIIVDKAVEIIHENEFKVSSVIVEKELVTEVEKRKDFENKMIDITINKHSKKSNETSDKARVNIAYDKFAKEAKKTVDQVIIPIRGLFSGLSKKHGVAKFDRARAVQCKMKGKTARRKSYRGGKYDIAKRVNVKMKQGCNKHEFNRRFYRTGIG